MTILVALLFLTNLHLGQLLMKPVVSILKYLDCIVIAGNLHLNVVAPTYDKDLMYEIEPIIFGFTKEHQGSISAEHGIGFKKPQHMHYSRKPESIELMRTLKNVFDPKGILNPYKMIPPSNKD